MYISCSHSAASSWRLHAPAKTNLMFWSFALQCRWIWRPRAYHGGVLGASAVLWSVTARSVDCLFVFMCLLFWLIYFVTFTPQWSVVGFKEPWPSLGSLHICTRQLAQRECQQILFLTCLLATTLRSLHPHHTNIIMYALLACCRTDHSLSNE